MKDSLEQRCSELSGKFDTEEPGIGHFDRFKVKLAMQAQKVPKQKQKTWAWITIAASIALLFGVWLGNYSAKPGLELADVSPKMEETQSFFMATIQQEIEQINLERNADNQQIIEDAFGQLKKLEENYTKLTVELDNSGKDKRIIYAMIANFQQRIDVLQSLLQQLEEIKKLKNNSNDEKIT